MNRRHWLLGTYGLLLQLYPPAFRKRFAEEMLEVAAAAAVAEWPLILGDTSLAIVRCWIEGSPSATAASEANAYLPLGGFPVRASGFLHGFVLSTVILLGLGYAAYRWPPACSSHSTMLTHIVDTPQETFRAAEPPHHAGPKLAAIARR